MWSGWGIRTLSSKNPAYNPYSYHLGSVWPHDNGIIAAGFKRYGLADEANQVIRGMFDAARRFEAYRLPEIFAGLKRKGLSSDFPALYPPGANIPQGWASGSIFHMVQTMLGLRAAKQTTLRQSDAPCVVLRCSIAKSACRSLLIHPPLLARGRAFALGGSQYEG
jgi:glycogen debranching enzyme